MSTALVIGGTSGVGLAVAQQLKARGDAVHIAGRNKERLDEAVAATGVEGHVLDAADADAVAALAAGIGPVDRLVLTLSGNRGGGPLGELPVDDLRQAFEEKYWPTVTAIRAALAHLAPAASITLVGAVTARAAMPGTAGLASLNAAVEGLVRPLAAELAPVRVNAVSPGYVDTPWWDAIGPEAKAGLFAQAAAALPVKRIASAADVAEAVVLLAVNPNLTGTVIESDGGALLTA
jgi:NAD(P)-dependent dehydrogenase (short-subunit alcohol dehydrogenase family)